MAPPEAGAEWLRKWDLKGAEKAEARQAGDSAAADLVHAALAEVGGVSMGPTGEKQVPSTMPESGRGQQVSRRPAPRDSPTPPGGAPRQVASGGHSCAVSAALS